MSHAELERALKAVPFLQTVGIRVEEARPGTAVLRLPWAVPISNHQGALHNAAVLAVGELSAQVALGTQVELAQLEQLHKSTKIKYYIACTRDVTAHASISPEMVSAGLRGASSGSTTLEVSVQVLDGHGKDIAELVCNFALRKR